MTANLLSFSTTLSPVFIVPQRRAVSSSTSSPASSSSSSSSPVHHLVVTVALIVLLMFAITALCQHARQSVGTIPGDLVIGALFPVHHVPGPKQAHTRTCGDIREQYGIHRVEAAFQTIDDINKDVRILPNITLGIEVRDSCWYSAIALEQSIEFIRDAMAASDEKALQASAVQAAAEAVLPVIKSQSLTNASKMLSSNSFYSPISPFVNAPFLFTPTLNASAICPKTLKKVKNIVGVIGPASSSVTIQVQNLLQLFNIPQVGYSATSRDLSIKSYYKYFLRVVPSDWLQARVIANLVRNYNWTYISVVYTDVNYGSSLMEVFKGLAQDVGICIANIESVPSTGDDEKFDDVVRNLQQFRTARVVACFCEGMTVRGLLKATKRLNVSGEFLFVGSDGWADRPDVVEGLEREAVGAVTVRIYSPYVTDFDEYYFKLSPLNNTRNPWFREFWETKFNCSLKNVTGTASVHPNGKMFTKPCTGKENLRDKHKQDTKLAFVKKAIWTMAYGLHNMQKSECPNTTGLCSQMLPVNGSVFLQHLLNVSFEWGNETVKFDDRGDPPGRYDVMNYQQIGDGEYDYVHVGSWISGGDINISRPLQWSANEMNMSSPPESYCSKPCDKGQAKKIQSDSVKCCWICVPCRDYQYLLDEYSCQACPMGWWPNNNLTGCYQIPVEYIQWNDTSSLVAMGIACLGFVMTLFAMVVFIKHNDTPVVKASTRELSYVIMIGMFLCHGTTFTLLAKPTKATCFVSRVLPGISFAIMYSALVTKTNRIARILAGSKKRIITKKPRFMSGSAQVVITWILISIEAGIIATMLVREPADKMLNYPSLNQVQLICNTTPLGIIAPLGFDFFLIAMCTVYAVKTRNVPENFNEAKFIGFTMYTTLVIWIAFVPIYFNSNAKVITLCLCISFSAIVAIVLLFFPKIYIMLFKPEKNNRSYFTTAKNVRCHIGYVPTMGVSRHSSHSTSEFSMESPRNHSLDVHYKRDSGPTSAFHHHLHHPQQTHYLDKKDVIIKAGSGGGSGGRKQGKLSLFERFRISKQDKIAANVQQHIRAVRAAEALDRQTARVRRRNSSKLMPQRSSSSGDDDTAIGSDTQKMRLVTMLKQAYGNEVEKVPGFIEFAESAKEDCRRSFVDAAAQTSYDLLETWFPALRKRIAQSEKLLNSEDEDMPSAIKSTTTSHRHTQQTKPLHSLQQQKHFGITSQLSRSPQSQATINYAFDEQNSSNTTTNTAITTKEQLKKDIEKDNNNIIMTLTSSPSSLSKTANNRRFSRPEMDINNKSRLFDGSSETSHFKDLTLSPSNKWSAGRDRDRDRDRDSPQPALTTTTTSSASPKHRQRKILSNTMSSDESLLSGTSSLVIEESASSGGDSSPGSGIYKNIIINLGGILPSYEQNTTHSATNTTTANTAATNNSAELDSSSTAQPWMTSMSGKR